jgi:hypothetical protein
METLTLEWEGILRIVATVSCTVKVSTSPPAIGIETEALATPAREPIPTELILTPTHAAELLALLQDLQRGGHIPRLVGHGIRTARH